MKDTGGPAFPQFVIHSNGAYVEGGMTLRQYAAIHLKVPNSGTEWLDEMIKQSMLNDFSAKATCEFVGFSTPNSGARSSYEWGKAMLDWAVK